VIPRIRTRRRAFTLVELMLVVALMAVLVALSTGAYFRIRASELVRATEATESKLNTLLDKRWKAVRTQATDDLNANTPASLAVMAFAGNDKDRARVVMTYLKLKNEFPTTVAEACAPIKIGTVVVYQPRSVFTSQFGAPDITGTPPMGLGTPEESAALFYLAITATGNRGETAGPDGTANQTGDVNITFTPVGGTQTSKPMRAYMDSWGNPIIFVRQAYQPELNSPPYVQAGVLARDMADPPIRTGQQGKLMTWTPAGLTAFWAIVSANQYQYSGFPNATSFPTTGGYPADTSGAWNWVPTVISAGPNKNVVKPPTGTGNPWDSTSPDGLFGGDNIVSYRLRREGNRGD
jgi:prepilin-type N-terminal cleavage/methylation domain-containing protein